MLFKVKIRILDTSEYRNLNHKHFSNKRSFFSPELSPVLVPHPPIRDAIFFSPFLTRCLLSGGPGLKRSGAGERWVPFFEVWCLWMEVWLSLSDRILPTRQISNGQPSQFRRGRSRLFPSGPPTLVLKFWTSRPHQTWHVSEAVIQTRQSATDVLLGSEDTSGLRLFLWEGAHLD